MPQVFAFDVYGTLVDPAQAGRHLEHLVGEHALEFGRLWHQKKVEYAFRRGLMELYQDFEICNRQALQYCLRQYQVELSTREQQQLLLKFGELEAFPDVIAGLAALKAAGHYLCAFSNGPETSVRNLLAQARILPALDDVISVDDVNTFKPSPRVYRYLKERTGAPGSDCWLISGNPWDVIGAKAAGLKAAWLQRDPKQVFDPWGIEPDLVVPDLMAFGGHCSSPRSISRRLTPITEPG